MFVQGLVKTGFIFKRPLKGIERHGIVDSKKEKEEKNTFFSKTKKRRRKNILREIESLTVSSPTKAVCSDKVPSLCSKLLWYA